MSLQRIETKKALEEILAFAGSIKLYGAGFYLNTFLCELGEMGNNYCNKIKCILVSDIKLNPTIVQGIPVVLYTEADLKADDTVFLTLGDRFTTEVYELLKGYGCTIVSIDFNLFQTEAYSEMKAIMQPFIDGFPKNILSFNSPVETDRKMAWTCWWQGEENAPELVKICLESQRKNLPQGVQHVIISEKNYSEYVQLPQYILDKAERGEISFTHLSDILRASLLYKWGGFWLDATVLLLEPLDSEIMDYPYYTRRIAETHFCTDTVWVTWFLYAKKGSKLFFFVSEGFYYYLSQNDRIKYYFMIDYLIAIACNEFPEVLEHMKEIPYNNDRSSELVKHLAEAYDGERYENYIKGTFLQKLTYKLDWREAGNKADTIYSYLKKSGLVKKGT